MQPRGTGHVVNVASMGGAVAMPGAAAYCASKHAVVGFCEALRWELAGTGIDLSYVLPALVNTELAADVKRTRAANVIEPEDVAAAIVGTLKTPKLAVYVPRSLGPVTRYGVLMPAQAGRQADDGFRVRSPAVRLARRRGTGRLRGARRRLRACCGRPARLGDAVWRRGPRLR